METRLKRWPCLSDELAGHSLTTALDEAAERAEAFLSTVEGQSAALDHWGLQIANVGTQVDLIDPPLHDLTGTIEDQSAALGSLGISRLRQHRYAGGTDPAED